MKQIQAYTQKDQIGVVLVGNKCDVENREVKKEEGEALASEYGLKYFETSALNNLNIEETFQHLAQEIIRVKDVKESGAVQANQNNNISLENKDKEKVAGKEKKCC
jgi:GTPase SAR1 family protein